MQIWHLRHQDINKARWDRAIKQSENGSLYGWSWYLDVVCPGWEALVNKDFSAIMPLPNRSRMGIPYLFQPLLSQQLGVFSKVTPDASTVEAFIRHIPKKYRWVHMTLNRQNQMDPPNIRMNKHTTFRLDLVLPYPHLQKQYHQNTRRNLKRIETGSLIYDPHITPESFLKLLSQDPGKGSRILLSQENETTFIRLLNTLIDHDAGCIPAVKNHDGVYLAAALLGYSHQQYYYLAPAQIPEGRDQRAVFYLIDQFIKVHAGRALVLDFEGSDIESLARFYSGFGASPVQYSSFYLNRFPWPLNHFFLHLSRHRPHK